MALAAAGLVGATGPAAARTDPAPVAPIDWAPCEEEFGEGRECATVQVPLDHDRPNGPTIGIAVLRLRATSPDERIGSVFLNPGGPGGSGVDIAAGVADVVPAELRERFDIVGFDPRGIMRSTTPSSGSGTSGASGAGA